MKTYIIVYHFSSNVRNYMPFYDAIKENMPECRHIMETAWIVKSDKTATEIRDLLMPYLHFESFDCDSIFVGELDKENVDGMIAKSYWSFITDKEEKKDEEEMG